MANAIELAKSYVPKLDEVYKLAALTSVLDSDGAELKEGANAGEFIIPKMSMDGLGAYDRNNGYAPGQRNDGERDCQSQLRPWPQICCGCGG